MGTTTAQELITKVEYLLFDASGTNWSQAELLGWISDGQREIAMLDPTSNANVTPVQLVAGAFQTLPADGYFLIDVYQNMGLDGRTPGPNVRVTSKRLMDNFNPNWPVDPPSVVVTNFVYDKQDILNYWVYPPSPGGNWVMINYAQRPADLTSAASTISIVDTYANALLEYVLFRCLSKNAGFAGNGERAAGHYAAFTAMVAGKSTAQVSNDPTQSLIPKPPITPGNES